MINLSKCFIEKDQWYWKHKVDFIYFKCPVQGHNHEICLPITTGDSFIAHKTNQSDYPVWHYEIKEGRVYLSPSVSCDTGECKFHDFFSFDEIVNSVENLW